MGVRLVAFFLFGEVKEDGDCERLHGQAGDDADRGDRGEVGDREHAAESGNEDRSGILNGGVAAGGTLRYSSSLKS